MPEASRLHQVATALQAYRYRFANEEELQAGVELALASAGGFTFEREWRLDAASRIDFFEPASGVGIECKVECAPADLARQCQRYLSHEEIAGLVLVTPRPEQARYCLQLAPERFVLVHARSAF